jgi:exosome complex component RRP46
MNKSRQDGRTATQLRPMSASQGALTRADGAVRFCFGDSITICSVNGPMEAKLKEEQFDRATVEVQYRPATGLPGKSLLLLIGNTHAKIVLCTYKYLYNRICNIN